MEQQPGGLRGMLRSFAETIGGFAVGEPATIVPRRTLDQLRELERRETLRQAEARGDDAFLDRELAAVQLTREDLKQIPGKTPVARWPDEDFEGRPAGR